LFAFLVSSNSYPRNTLIRRVQINLHVYVKVEKILSTVSIDRIQAYKIDFLTMSVQVGVVFALPPAHGPPFLTGRERRTFISAAEAAEYGTKEIINSERMEDDANEEVMF